MSVTKIIFAYNNLLDSATLTASSENASFPASNLKNPFRSKVWRTAGATAGTANLVINHGSAKAVTCVALIGYNWTSAPGTLNFEANATDAWGAPSFQQALTWAANPTANGNPGIIFKTFASQSYQYNRLNVVYSPGGSPTDWNLGRIFVGTYFQPAKGFRRAHQESIIDPSYISQTIGGQDHVDTIAKYRTMTFDCQVLTQAQWESYQAMINNVGASKDMVIAFDYSNEPDEMTWYGKFIKIPGMKRDALFELSFAFQESR
jgi:hypothetical protein